MRIVLQRVHQASVACGHETVAAIDDGLLLLTCIEAHDTQPDIEWSAERIRLMHIFADEAGKMNLSLEQMGAKGPVGVIVVPQFTIAARYERNTAQKCNRPSFTTAARPEKAIPLLSAFCSLLQKIPGLVVQQGRFGADMQVALVNDGPATFVLDSCPVSVREP